MSKKVDIPGHFCYILGEAAEEALDYIMDQENRMNHQGGGNSYFFADYTENMIRFYEDAIRKFGVRIFDTFSGREYKAVPAAQKRG